MTFVGHTDFDGWYRLHSAVDVPGALSRTLVGNPAQENLPVGFPEVLWEESIDDWVNRRVTVGQTVSDHPEHKRGLVQGERAKLHPEVDDVVRQPRQTEDHDHN